MSYNDHMPSHFYVEYGEFEAVYSLDGDCLQGDLPKKQRKLVEAWVVLHEEDLKANWELAKQHEELFEIDPLR